MGFLWFGLFEVFFGRGSVFIFVCLFFNTGSDFFQVFFTCILSACRARDFGVYFKKVLKISASDYDSLV